MHTNLLGIPVIAHKFVRDLLHTNMLAVRLLVVCCSRRENIFYFEELYEVVVPFSAAHLERIISFSCSQQICATGDVSKLHVHLNTTQGCQEHPVARGSLRRAILSLSVGGSVGLVRDGSCSSFSRSLQAESRHLHPGHPAFARGGNPLLQDTQSSGLSCSSGFFRVGYYNRVFRVVAGFACR